MVINFGVVVRNGEYLVNIVIQKQLYYESIFNWKSTYSYHDDTPQIANHQHFSTIYFIR